jgi:hypothetical protein
MKHLYHLLHAFPDRLLFRTVRYVIYAILALLLSSCCTYHSSTKGSENIVSKTYDFKDFDALEISRSFDVRIIPSDTYKVVMSYNDNMASYVEVQQYNRTLRLSVKPGGFRNFDPSATLHLPHIKKIRASGASDITMEEYRGTDLDLNFSGATKFTAKLLQLDQLKMIASGATHIDIEGTVQNGNIYLSGASRFKGEQLTVSQDLSLNGSGASRINLIANGNIDLSLSGASHFTCEGTGSIVKRIVSGASRLNKK